ncbi:MAG: hypothetical protein R3B95_07200 [Nitrospirales bacterium]|nr:hypothetical protein [Nitrospirales bacterium]
MFDRSQDWEVGFVNSLGRIFLPSMEHLPLLDLPSRPGKIKAMNQSAQFT